MTNLIAKFAGIAVVSSLSGLALSGCADGTNMLTTGSLATPKIAAAPAVNPICTALVAKINGLRDEGTMARLAKVAAGKSRSAMVKRISLGKAAELDLANAEFQAKCTTFTPSAAIVKVPTPASSATKAKTAAKKKSGKKAAKVAKAVVAKPAAQPVANTLAKILAQKEKQATVKAVKSVVTSVPKN